MEVEAEQYWYYYTIPGMIPYQKELRPTLYPDNVFLKHTMENLIEDKLKTIKIINEEITYIENKLDELCKLSIENSSSHTVVILRNYQDHEFIFPSQEIKKLINDMQQKYLDRKAELFENAKVLMK